MARAEREPPAGTRTPKARVGLELLGLDAGEGDARGAASRVPPGRAEEVSFHATLVASAGVLRAALLAAGFFVLLGACLFLPAGRVAWPMAWACLAVLGAVTASTFVLADPGLLRERAAPGPGVDRRDVAVAGLGFLALYPGTLVVAGFDAGRGAATPPLPVAVRALGFVVFTLGYAFADWAVRANPFFATFVRIQTDRGHRVVDTGPYAWVRHPGYAGALAAHLALPLALGSLWTLIPAVLGAALFAVRTAHEDRFLVRRLPGYRAYRERVRWRLIPGVW